MALIELERLTFRYALGDAPVLRDINLQVERGEFLLLCGPSGGGKSTLLRHLKPELWPAGERSGRVLYGGEPIETLPRRQSAAEIGLVLQDPENQIVTDVVWHELAFGLENLGADSDVVRRRVAEMASFFGIGHWFRRKTSDLSGGQKQMLNLAAVLTLSPRVLLLDEPLAMLDPLSARAFADMLGRLNRELGLTIVVVSHRVDDLFHLAGRVAFLEAGRLLCCLPPRGLGDFLSAHPQAWPFMPAPLRVAHAVGGPERGALPLTVREGRAFLQARLAGRAQGSDAPLHPAPGAAGQNEKARRDGPAALACKGASFAFSSGAPRVLRDVSLELRAGELVCLLGENGAGKSTLLRLLAGLARPTGGAVFLGGARLDRLAPAQKWRGHLALLPQETRPLFVCDTLLEDYRAVSGEADARAMAEQLGLSPLLGSHPYDLSGGEAQRAAIGKLLLTRPSILLLDEPTRGLDAPAREMLAVLLNGFCVQGGAVLLVTHDLEFAASHAGRCLLLFDGEIVCDEPPRAFFAGNYFYTTAASRMARDFAPNAVTCEDVERLCAEKS